MLKHKEQKQKKVQERSCCSLNETPKQKTYGTYFESSKLSGQVADT